MANQQLARDREDDVLGLVCSALTDGGRLLEVVARPDRESSPGASALTVDAVLAVTRNGVTIQWAADVCLVPYQQEVASADSRVRKALNPNLEELARVHSRVIRVFYRPEVASNASEFSKWLRSFTKRATEAAAELVGEGIDHQRFGDDLSISIDAISEAGGRPGVEIFTWVSGSDPDIGSQLRRDLVPVVTRKLRGQLARASEQGLKTALILDQRGSIDLPVPPNFLATEFSIVPLLEELMGEYPVLNAVVLVKQDDSVREVIGKIDVTN